MEDPAVFLLILFVVVATAGALVSGFLSSIRMDPLPDLDGLSTALMVAAARPGTRLKVCLCVPEGAVVTIGGDSVSVSGAHLNPGYILWLNRKLREAYGAPGGLVASATPSQVVFNFSIDGRLVLGKGSYVLEVTGVRPGEVAVRLLSSG